MKLLELSNVYVMLETLFSEATNVGLFIMDQGHRIMMISEMTLQTSGW